MSKPSLRPAAGAGQQSRPLGEHRPTPGVRLSLHATDRSGEAVLLRHRSNPHAGSAADIAARVIHHGGVVSRIRWDDYHSRGWLWWISEVEDWIRARIAAGAA